MGNNTELIYIIKCIMMPAVKRDIEQYSISKINAYMGDVPAEQKENTLSLNENIHYS